jgi:hypothetical protein
MAVKKTAKKARRTAVATAEVPREPSKGALDPDVVRRATQVLVQAAQTYREVLRDLPDEGEMTQDMIAMAHVFNGAESALSDVSKSFAANALRLRAAGSFAPGKLRVEFTLQKGKRSVAWKAEAVRQATFVAKLKGEEFNPKQYEELIHANTAPSPDTYKAVIRETA